MRTAILRDRVSHELLPRVREPAQYIGGEVNQLVKPGRWESADVRVAVAFPDTYGIGMSHLGCQIIYWLCNHTPGVCAERTYCPWVDAERVMRERGIPLFTWDTRQPVRDADILAISLQYELCYTSVLNLLDLAGVPLRCDQRTDRDPLVIAGGPQADNPEPLADFLDLVVMGDGEHSMAAILEAYREYKRAGTGRREMIVRMARRFPWVYAPSLYEASYHADGTLAALTPRLPGLPARIERCKTPDFETIAFPTRPIVPWTDVVHDRIGIEIMRGCPQVCRFCHAGYTKRPLTLRSVGRILDIAEEAYWATGQHEIGLLSLSTADYPHLRELSDVLNERFASRMVNLSFPSLRVDKMLANIPWMARSVRKGSLTIAVEAANDDMRRAIRKKVTDGNLLEGVRQAYLAGWNRVKLYFMSGFPGERPEDIDGIWRLANEVSQERRAIGKGPAQVTASVGWLVPKPFTPLQWMAQPRREYYDAVRRRLRWLEKGGYAPEDFAATNGATDDRADERSTRGLGDDAAGASAAGSRSDAAAARASDAGDSAGRRAANVKSEISERSGASAFSVQPSDLTARPGVSRVPDFKGRIPRRRASAVRITMPTVEASILEGVIARGDRRLGPVIHEAWQRGARLDGWTECFRWDVWQEAFAACGVDPDWYAHRERSPDELLPWDHIGTRLPRGFLSDGYDDMFQQIRVERPPAGITVPSHGLQVVSAS